MPYLAEDLITAVKRRCNVPTSQITFQTADFLALADEEIRSKLVPLVLKHMEEFYVTYQDQAIVGGQSIYPIPYRAIAMALRDVQIVSNANNDVRVGLERLSPEELYGGSGRTQMMIQKSGFILQGNSVLLYPTPAQSVSDLLRLYYCMRPSQIVSTNTCGLVTAVDLVGNTLTLTSVPSTITTLTTVDLVRAIPGFECTAIDQTISNIAGSILTFSSALPQNVSVGDYVCLSNQSCIVQVPVELQPLLYQYVVIRVLSAQGDQSNLKAAAAELVELEKAAGLLLAPRVAGKAKRVVNARSIARWV